MSTEPVLSQHKRFRIERPVGTGGMATVYAAFDAARGRTIALKLLRATDDAQKHRQHQQLFEREFHTLAQLAHPRVVEVYDYGVGEDGAYYTMELLDGGDLNQLAPVPWARACSLARDVCSALSLLHSRRVVHRDVSPRNVRCTSDGKAKLIDFGAMTMMGAARQLVGTPPYCAPEAVNMQPLDARTDLFALGATLYFTLVGRHAYPARDFRQVRQAWQRTPPAPSALVPDIPPALDALVLELIHLDPSQRPANAAEVMERLGAIAAATEDDERLLVPQSYLCTPTLIGRDTLLQRARLKTMRALRGRGGSLLIEGRAGLGRSRLLDACILEAKLAGLLVLRADARDAASELGVARALCAQLLEAVPEAALGALGERRALLTPLLPSEPAAAPLADSIEARGRLLPALHDWLLAVSEQAPLMIAIDDVHAIDEPSAALLALLARSARRARLALALTQASDAPVTSSPAALKLIGELATKLEPTALSGAQTEQLLRSLFGDVPHLQELAHRLLAISHGVPRDVMQLAQHLIDRGSVRYEAGAWSLPARFEAHDLPGTMAQALAARIERLSPPARRLALALALIPDMSVTFEECVALCAPEDAARTSESIDELLRASVIQPTQERYALARGALGAALLAVLDAGTARALHLRVSELFAARDPESFDAALHLLRAGEHERGLDAVIASAQSAQQVTYQSRHAFSTLIRSVASDWYPNLARALELCEQLGRPKRDAAPILTRLCALLGAMGIVERKYMPRLIAQLRRESGLAAWDELPESLPPMDRLKQALEAAQQRYAETPEHDRVHEPIVAIRQLSRTIIQTVAVASHSLDVGLLRSLPSLEPLEPLSPALWVVQRLVNGNLARTTGRFDEARAQYALLLERTSQPDRGGLDEAHHANLQLGVMSGLGMLEAGMGLPSCRAWADRIESEPLHQINARLIRMLQHLFQGELSEAARLVEQIELLRIESGSRQWFEGTHLVYQITALAMADDLTRVKQTLAEISAMAARYPSWEPVRLYAEAEYRRIRGELPAAEQALATLLETMQAGGHQLWAYAAGAHVRVLLELGDGTAAIEHGRRHLEAGARAQLGFALAFVQLPLAVALAGCGAIEEGAALAQSVAAGFEELGTRGILLAYAYETCARVAIARQDVQALERYSALCAAQLRRSSNRLLSAKNRRLAQAAARAELSVTRDFAGTQPVALTPSRMQSAFELCGSAAERAQQSLRLLMQHAGAIDGAFYFINDAGEPELAAKSDDWDPPSMLLNAVQNIVDAEVHESETQSGTGATASGSISGRDMNGCHPLLLSHLTQDGVVLTAVAMLSVLPGEVLRHPGAVTSDLSRLLFEAGDCGMARTSDG